MNKTEKPIFDVRKELIKCKVWKEAQSYSQKIIYYIKRWGDIEKWGEKYREKGKLELEELHTIRDQLLNAIPHLTEEETDMVIVMMNRYDPNQQKKTIEFIFQESPNLELGYIAVIVYDCLFPHNLLNVFEECCKRFIHHKRYGTAWQKRRKEILKQRGNKCENCGSTEKIEVHHKKGWDDEEDEDLEVLCKKCHMDIRHEYGKNDNGNGTYTLEEIRKIRDGTYTQEEIEEIRREKSKLRQIKRELFNDRKRQQKKRREEKMRG